MLERGSRFAGDYLITRVVAEDMAGGVYGARRGEEDLRLRVLAPGTLAEAREHEAFVACVHAAFDGIGEPALPRVAGVGVDAAEARGWVATEWIAGSSLVEICGARGGLPVGEARGILADVARALGALHVRGFGHGALEPAVVMRVPSGPGAVTTRVVDAVIGSWSQLHPSRAVEAESPHLLSLPPERIMLGRSGGETLADDVWAFGLLAFFVLTARSYWPSPVEAPPYKACVRRILRRELVAAEERARGALMARPLPAGFDAWLSTCLASSDDRPDLATVAGALDQLLAGAETATAAEGEAEARAAAAARRRAAESSHTVEPADWPRLVAEVAAGTAIELGETTASAEGVAWRLPLGVTLASARALVERIAAVAALLGRARHLADEQGLGGRLRGLFGPSPAKQLTQLLAELHLEPPIDRDQLDPRSAMWPFIEQPAPGTARAALTKEGLSVHYVHEAWITSHDTGSVSTEYARVPRDRLPADPALARELLEAIVAAAPLCDDRPARRCKYCEREVPALHMHDADTCQDCAEVHLGILH